MIEGISRLHVLPILHRDVVSMVLITSTNLVETSVVCHRLLCLLRLEEQIFRQIKYKNKSK